MEAKVVEIKLGKEKAQYYNALTDKYQSYGFESDQEEKEYLNCLKNLLNEEDSELEFEVKVALLRSLVGGIKLKKFDGIHFTKPQNN